MRVLGLFSVAKSVAGFMSWETCTNVSPYPSSADTLASATVTSQSGPPVRELAVGVDILLRLDTLRANDHNFLDRSSATQSVHRALWRRIGSPARVAGARADRSRADSNAGPWPGHRTHAL